MASTKNRQEVNIDSREFAALQSMSEHTAERADFDELLRAFLDNIVSAYGFKFAAIYLLDPQEEFLRGYMGEGWARQWYETAWGKGYDNIFWYVVKTGEIKTMLGWHPLLDRETSDRSKHYEFEMVFCPIRDGVRVVGVLEAGYKKEEHNRIGEKQIRGLRIFLNFVETGLQKLSRNEAILGNLESETNMADPYTALELLVRGGCELLDANRGSVHIVKNDVLEAVAWYRANEQLNQPDKPQKMGKGEGITGFVWESGKPYICMDSRSDPHYEKFYDDELSEIAAPILSLSGDTTIGVLNFTHPEVRHFKYRGEQLLRKLTIFASRIIDRQDFAELMQEINKVADHIEYNDFLRFVLNKARLLIKVPASFAIWKLDETTGQLHHIDLGLPDDPFGGKEIPVLPSIIGNAIKSKIPTAVYDIWEEPWRSIYKAPEIAEQAGFRSLLSIPLMSLGHPIGAISIHTQLPHEFDAIEQSRTSAFAREVANAIEDRRRVAEVNNLKEMLHRTAGLDLDSAQQAIGELVRNITRADSVIIILRREDGFGFRPAVQSGRKYKVEPPRPDGGTIDILRFQSSVFIESVSPDMRPPPVFPAWVKSYIGLLLGNQDELFGVMYIDFAQPRVFPPRFREHLEVLAGQASLAIETIVIRERVSSEKERIYRAAVDRVSADTAHMIGNRLSPMSSRLYILENQLHKLEPLVPTNAEKLRQGLMEGLEHMRNLLGAAMELINEVRKSGNFRLTRYSVSLSKMVASFMADTIVEPNTFRVEDQGRSWIATVDGKLILGVFGELVQNSIEMADGPVEIGVRFEDQVSDPRRNLVRIIYSDNGPGVPDHLKERIFGKFYSRHSDENKRGNGLGLHNALRVIERHGGKITERGKYGEGAEFHIILPTTDDTELKGDE